jgi:hypothetical protein
MTEEQAPKSAYEIAMARLRAKDREAGIEERPVTEAQRARLAELRQIYDARLAEREILHRSERAKARDEESLTKLDEDYQRERERIQNERDRKLEEARRQD